MACAHGCDEITQPHHSPLLIQNWISSIQPLHFPPSTNNPIECLVNIATAEEQSLIGWEEVFKGRLSTKWAEAKQAWYDSLRRNHCDLLEIDFPRHYTGKVWSKQIIASLIYYNLNRWQIRNEVAHATATVEAQATIRTKYSNTNTYIHGDHTNAPIQSQHFRKPLADLLSILPHGYLIGYKHSNHHKYTTHIHAKTYVIKQSKASPNSQPQCGPEYSICVL